MVAGGLTGVGHSRGRIHPRWIDLLAMQLVGLQNPWCMLNWLKGF